eukprot:CAMPEP_0114492152 /NCGR_PEP_ID=MMETSP0109-20121206/3395_1 /TAXON_ID=29199 /ORGANISM="Chlorarachnion reptans, Strain CCCM449" /LENGTH=525 /DNA_ID=CAMNT_0001668961 /DNA_START=177 /DNA_END=1752 /DNA_ORIENTATION=-
MDCGCPVLRNSNNNGDDGNDGSSATLLPVGVSGSLVHAVVGKIQGGPEGILNLKESTQKNIHWFEFAFKPSIVLESFDGVEFNRTKITKEILRAHIRDLIRIVCGKEEIQLCQQAPRFMGTESEHTSSGIRTSQAFIFAPDICTKKMDLSQRAFVSSYPHVPELIPSLDNAFFFALVSNSPMNESNWENYRGCTVQQLGLDEQLSWPLQRFRFVGHSQSTSDTFIEQNSRSFSMDERLANCSKNKDQDQIPPRFADYYFEIESNEDGSDEPPEDVEDADSMLYTDASSLIQAQAFARIMTGQMGGPATAAAIPKISNALLKVVGKGVQHQLARDVWSAVTARVPGQVTGLVEQEVRDQILKKLPKKVWEQVVKDLTWWLPEDMNLYLLDHVSERLIPQLHRDLDYVLYHNVSSTLSKIMPVLLQRSLRTTLTHTLSWSISHSLIPALTIALSRDNRYYCIACRSTGRGCGMCHSSPQGEYYSLYYATYYADYFGPYYRGYYTTAAEKMNTAEAKEDVNPYLKEAW